MQIIPEEHVSDGVQPSKSYLTYYVPNEPESGEKPAMKQAQKLYEIMVEYNSVESLKVPMGDSTATNTGWKGGVNALLEKLTRGFWDLKHREIWL